MYLSVYMLLYHSVYLSYLSVGLKTVLPVSLYRFISTCRSMYMLVYLCVFLSVGRSVCLSLWLYVCRMYTCLSYLLASLFIVGLPKRLSVYTICRSVRLCLSDLSICLHVLLLASSDLQCLVIISSSCVCKTDNGLPLSKCLIWTSELVM